MKKVDRVLRKLGLSVQPWKRPRTPLDVKTARRILSKAGLCEQVLKVHELFAGWNTMYLVKTEEQPYCFRVFTNDFAGYGTDWKPAKEKYVLDLMRANHVKAPSAYYADCSNALLEHPFMIMEYKPGISARVALSTRTMSEEDRYRIFHDAGKQMALIHSIDMRELGILDYRLRGGTRWTLGHTIEQYISKCPKCSARDNIHRYFGDMIDLIPEKPHLVAVHTEFTDRNLLVLPDASWGISSVIDMEWFVRSIPEHEFARLTTGWIQAVDRGNDLESDLGALLSGYYEAGGRLCQPKVIPGFVVLNQFLIEQPTKIKRKRAEDDWKRLEALDKLVPTYEAVIAKLSRGAVNAT